jgi:hypothetical protein
MSITIVIKPYHNEESIVGRGSSNIKSTKLYSSKRQYQIFFICTSIEEFFYCPLQNKEIDTRQIFSLLVQG